MSRCLPIFVLMISDLKATSRAAKHRRRREGCKVGILLCVVKIEVLRLLDAVAAQFVPLSTLCFSSLIPLKYWSPLKHIALISIK